MIILLAADDDKTGPQSRAGDIYQVDGIMKEYHAGFGFNPELMHIFDNNEFKFSGHDDNGEPRLCEIAGHRFVIGTAFQAECSALKSRAYPLITAFLRAAL